MVSRFLSDAHEQTLPVLHETVWGTLAVGTTVLLAAGPPQEFAVLPKVSSAQKRQMLLPEARVVEVLHGASTRELSRPVPNLMEGALMCGDSQTMDERVTCQGFGVQGMSGGGVEQVAILQGLQTLVIGPNWSSWHRMVGIRFVEF